MTSTQVDSGTIGSKKKITVPDYGLALLKHLSTEYSIIVSRREMNEKAREWQDKIISEKKQIPCSALAWSDIGAVEQAVLSVVEDEGLVSKARTLRERYRIAIGDTKYQAYEATLPACTAKLNKIDISQRNVKLTLRSELHNLISQIYWIYDSTTESSRLRYNAKWYVTVILGAMIGLALFFIHRDWNTAIANCNNLKYTFPVIGVIVLMGACGACVSFLRRLSQLPPNIENLTGIIELRKSFVDVSLAIVSGSFFAIFLLVILASDLPKAIFSSSFLPKFTIPQAFKCIEAPEGTLIGFIRSLYVTEIKDMAVIFILSFIAGFAEQFVPNVINRLISVSQVDEIKKS